MAQSDLFSPHAHAKLLSEGHFRRGCLSEYFWRDVYDICSVSSPFPTSKAMVRTILDRHGGQFSLDRPTLRKTGLVALVYWSVGWRWCSG
jgi:hypothetical protein